MRTGSTVTVPRCTRLDWNLSSAHSFLEALNRGRDAPDDRHGRDAAVPIDKALDDCGCLGWTLSHPSVRFVEDHGVCTPSGCASWATNHRGRGNRPGHP
jgi:hypothetical protein